MDAENETAENETAENYKDLPLPPATFEFLVLSLKTQAELQLGLLHFGEEKDRPEPNPRVARHSIDLLAMLVEKTKGNLNTEEKRLAENSLTELRFRYVQSIEQANKKKPEAKPEPQVESAEKSESQASS